MEVGGASSENSRLPLVGSNKVMAMGKEEPELLDVIKLLEAKTLQHYHITELQLLRIWVCRGYARLLVLSLLKMSIQITTQHVSKPQ